jgi:hypothetical protein
MKAFGATFQDRDLFVSSHVNLTWGNRRVGKEPVMKKLISSCAFVVGLVMGLSACTDPYDPGQQAIGGGLFGAGTGAAMTPSPSYYGYGSSGSGYNRYGSYGARYYGSGYNGYGSYGPQYYGSDYNGSDYNGSDYNGSGYYGYGR